MPWFWPWSRAKKTAPPTEQPTFVVMGGRKIKVDSAYILPIDLGESNRLDLQHYLLRYVLNGNFVAPIRNPHDILDVGCGTGRWGAEMAQQFPNANIVGVDIAPPSPGSAAVTLGIEASRNYIFVEGDITKGLSFPDNSFDFTHMRLVVAALPLATWAPAIAELRRVTKPGGWIELVDTDVNGRSPSGVKVVNWGQTLARARGIDFQAGARIGDFLRQAGLRNVTQTTLQVPLGTAGGRVGNLMMVDSLAAVRAMEAPIVDMAHLTTHEEFGATVAAMEREFRTMPNLSQPFYIAYGQK